MSRPSDDRGNPCGVAGMSWKQLGWHLLGLRRLTRDAQVKRQQRITSNAEQSFAAVGSMIGTAAVLPLLLGPGAPRGFVPLFVIGMTGAFALGIPAWLLGLRWARRRKFDAISAIYIDAGRCAGCGYTLADLAAEPDGCVVCPECGAAWRADRLG